MKKIFIDGSAGTTGLRIFERLSQREDIELITLDDSVRKERGARKEAINCSDISFLCLPDEAAKEAVGMVENPDTVIIDTSTAHRTDPAFTYGFPEVVGYDKIKNSRRIANPGCHASGFTALVFPLVRAGIIKKEARLCCFSLTGYSGGGKKMIALYEDRERSPLLCAPRQYGLCQNHKHLKEMAAVAGLENPPVFCPVVGDFYSGMEVTVTLNRGDFCGCLWDIKEIFKEFYKNGLVEFSEQDEEGFLSAGLMSGKDKMLVSAFGNEDRIILVSRFDNLGKGASGAAIQNMNIVLGVDQRVGLEI